MAEPPAPEAWKATAWKPLSFRVFTARLAAASVFPGR